MRLLETALYVDDVEAVAAFFRDVLGFEVMDWTSRLVALDAGQSTVLLVFKRGATTAGLKIPGGWIPPHDGGGPVHLAFAIEAGELSAWEQCFANHSVAIESQVQWEGGGRSLYFRDPAGHSV